MLTMLIITALWHLLFQDAASLRSEEGEVMDHFHAPLDSSLKCNSN